MEYKWEEYSFLFHCLLASRGFFCTPTPAKGLRGFTKGLNKYAVWSVSTKSLKCKK